MTRNSSVSEVMTRDVLAFAPDDNVLEAMETLVQREFSGAPVVDESGAVVGVISTGDLIVQESKLHFPTIISILGATIELPSAKRQFEDDLRRTLGSTVGEVMQPEPITIGADETIEAAATLMHDHDVARLPVVDDSGLVGILARVDILRAILSEERDA